MKRFIGSLLILALFVSAVCFGEAAPDLFALTGLDEMFERLASGETICSLSYSDNAYEGPENDFVTDDPDEIMQILNALLQISIVSSTDVFLTDWYPAIRFVLSDGSEYSLRFDWEYLEVDGTNYILANDGEFWGTIDDIAVIHAQDAQIREESIMETVFIPGSLGSIYGELFIPAGSGKAPLIILSHGFGGNHTYQGDYAEYFQSKGFATYNFDFCGGGHRSQSEGSMTEMSVLTEAKDLTAIVDHFSASGRFDGIYLWGASQGGFVSSYVAAMRPEVVKALAVEYPAYVIQDDAKTSMRPDGSFPDTYTVLGTTIGHVYGEDATSFDIYDVIAAYKGDVLILHGNKDGLVPIGYSERAVRVFEHAELVVMEGQDHGFTGADRQRAMQLEAEFFLRHAGK